MAKQITTYQANDGSMHESMFAATQHEKKQEFLMWVREQFPSGGTYSADMIALTFLREYGIPTKLKDQKGKTQVIG